MKRLLAIAIISGACGEKPVVPAAHEGPPSTTPAVTAAAGPPTGAAAIGPSTPSDPCDAAKPEGGMAMPWIADDLAGALACASRRDVPVVIDEWAPWCHTCLSMQSTVFTDPSLKADADNFVFVALDTDKEVNAGALARYPTSAWPTFYVIGKDNSTGQANTVLARFVGAASLAQFHTFLDAGRKAQAGGAAGADAHMLGAERAMSVKDYGTADQEFAAALAQAPASWSRRSDALVSQILSRARRKDFAGCITLAEQSLDATGNAAAATDFLVTAKACAEELKGDAAMAPRIKKLDERAVARLAKLTADAKAPLSVDDRSDALATLREFLDLLDKHADALATAEKQRALLDDTAAKAPTPWAAMTYNWQRCEVYVYLGKPLDLVPAIEKSAQDLPAEYDPRARLGWLYLKAGKLPEATHWTDEALKMVYGPRKARVLTQRAEIAAKQNDKAAELRYRQDTVKLWETMPAGQANPEALDKAKQAVAALQGGTSSGAK